MNINVFLFSSIVILVSLFTACSGGDWEGFVYRTKDTLSPSKHIGTFPTLAACRSNAVSVLRSLGRSEKGTYLCGQQCTNLSDVGTRQVCAITER